MKPLFLHTILIFLGLQTALCQIPNSGFEDWVESNGHFNPQGWWCANDSVQSGTVFPVNRTSDHFPPNSGSYAIRIENHVELLPAWSAFGITWTGDLAGNDNPAFAINGHPVSLYGYYKFLPVNGDTFEIHLRLYNQGEDVGGGQFKTADMVNSWQPFSFDFSDYDMADSARIMILACYNNDAPDPAGNSTLFIDNLSFDSLVVNGMNWVNIAKSTLKIHPNPASNFITISNQRLDDGAIYSISDLQGREWERMAFNSTNQVIHIAQLPAGVYCIRLLQSNILEQVLLFKE